MRQYTHPKDAELAGLPTAQVRKMGKKKRGPARWKVAAAAKLAPHELDDLPEDPIRHQIEADIKAAGLPYLTLEDGWIAWLVRMAGRHWQARAILDAIKDLPDFVTWRPAPGQPFALSLPLELKRMGKGGRPGQRAFAQAAGGFITQGYTEARAVLDGFLAVSPTFPNRPE